MRRWFGGCGLARASRHFHQRVPQVEFLKGVSSQPPVVALLLTSESVVDSWRALIDERSFDEQSAINGWARRMYSETPLGPYSSRLVQMRREADVGLRVCDTSSRQFGQKRFRCG
mmetsp:Transcript_2588/g.11358  ORF Transcript_2588/g.11358 Transcript_2588/m.11358 type:complete len:115 (-) Transcript_2588:1536-1880(-)